jgi:hypothetical protein
VRPRRNVVPGGFVPQPGGYGVAAGDAAGEAAGEASASAFFLVVLFLVVVADFFVVSFFAGSFLVVAAVELGVVVTDSFLLAHDVIKPKTARTAMDVISDCFISCG